MRLFGIVVAFSAALVGVSQAAGLAELASQIPACGVSKLTGPCGIVEAHTIGSYYAWKLRYQHLHVLSPIRHVYVQIPPSSHPQQHV